MQFLRKLFDTSKRDVESMMPLVAAINELEEQLSPLSDEDLRAYALNFKPRVQKGETMDALLPEVFACVREVSKRKLGMRHFDVQLVGAVVLHRGRISEMKTGEGKTLVAVGPLILNALTGRGSHLVTVNDYLARRDAVWMGPVYDFMGLSVGIIQGQSDEGDELGGSYRYVPGAPHEDPRYADLVPVTRREAYNCDITYGTNHEFGFDYLRDNMAFNETDLVMRELHYAIVDEVDSILIDEARTPHIISGPSAEDVSVYKEVDVIVRKLEREKDYTVNKKDYQASLTEDGMDRVEQLLGIDNIAGDPRLFHHVTASVKAYGLFDKDIEYVVRGGEVVLVDENTGRLMFGRRLSDGLHQALEAKEGVTVQRESQTVATITFQNLFRLYEKLAGMTGTAKTEEDEFRKIYGLDVVTVPTHRDMVRTDREDVIFKTQEAKFRAIAWEILRVYTKQQPVLVGTRSIEQSEKVSSRLTSDMLQLLVIAKRFQKLLESKDVPKDLRKDVNTLFETALADWDRSTASTLLAKLGLSGNPREPEWLKWCLEEWKLPAEDEEHLDEALSHGIPHNVLNAKFHEREALIIAEAGRKGQVTIATNMAGRGVDILLGGRVEDDIVRQSRGKAEVEEEALSNYRRGGKERATPPLPLDDTERRALAEDVRGLGGLYILGTERHESRRIDNQLRGRSGRQGDPGESKFFVALEDQLWKIFDSKMLENPLLKGWPPMEEVNQKMLSKMIEKTQERIESHFFAARKQVLEYDDVLNAQREHIYGWRREIMLGKDERPEIQQQMDDLVAEVVNDAWMLTDDGEREYDYHVLNEDLNEVMPLLDYAVVKDLSQHTPGPELIEYCQGIARKAYDDKIQRVGDEPMKALERYVMLNAVNDKWMEHLQTVEYIREGIGLRGYGQIDPLVAYKRETYDAFQATLRSIRDQAVRMFFKLEPRIESAETEPEPMMLRMDGAGATNGHADAKADLGKVDWKRVGRNDPCPCRSGKKFKHCHYTELRAKGEI